MHKDPPPGLFDRPIGVIVTYGLLTGFIAGALAFGSWSFFTAVSSRDHKPQPSPLERRH